MDVSLTSCLLARPHSPIRVEARRIPAFSPRLGSTTIDALSIALNVPTSPSSAQAVVDDKVAYFAGRHPNPIVGDIKTQTAQGLRRVDELLKLAGTDKSRLLNAQVWIADTRLFEDHNSVRNEAHCIAHVMR